MILPYLLIVVVAYLLGSVPSGYVLMRLFRHEDIRNSGSGNIGATNVLRFGGKGLAAATFLMDMLKGCLAVWLGGLIGGLLAPGAAPDNMRALAAISVFIVMLALSRYVSLASILGAGSFPFFAWWLGHGDRPAFFIAVQIAVALLLIVKHHPNIRRLLSGTESKLGANKTA